MMRSGGQSGIFRLAAVSALLLGCSGSEGAAETPDPSYEGEALLVANKRANSLSRIDLASGKESHVVDTCANPHELTVSPDDALVMVACYSGRTLEIYATADLRQLESIELGQGARVHSALWLGDFGVIAGAEGRGSLYVIDNLETDEPTPFEIGGGGSGPHLLATDSEGRQAWGTIIPRGEVVRYDVDGFAEARRRKIGEQTEAIALSPDGKSLWVGSNSANKLYRLDPQTLDTVAEIEVGQVPIRVAAHPGGEFVVTSNFGGGDLSVIDVSSNEVVRTIPVSRSRSSGQVTLVFSDDGERLFVAETADNRIAEVDFASGTILRRLAAGNGGDGMAIAR